MDDKKPIIKASTPNSDRYDGKIDVSSNNPREDHKSIHIVVNTDDGTGHIIDNTDGKTEHTDIKCYLTTACMKHKMENFNDNCEELTLLRWFRNNFVSEEDIEHYYAVAPLIVTELNKIENNEKIYNYIYESVILTCVSAIKEGNYAFAYSKYKNSILTLEEQFVKPILMKRMIKALNIL